MLAKINGISASHRLVAGESLKVMRGPFRAEVSLDNREMALFLGRYYAGRFPIRVGADLPIHETVYENRGQNGATALLRQDRPQRDFG